MNETHKIQVKEIRFLKILVFIIQFCLKVFLLDTNCESSSTQTQQTYEKPQV